MMRGYNSVVSKRILETLLRSSSILLVSHRKPDGDTIGSALALFEILQEYGKRVYMFCVDMPTSEFGFLPGIDFISTDHEFLFSKRFNTVVVLDSGDIDYTGIGDYLLDKQNDSCPIINIDHHATNTFYGNLNLVESNASSTAEVVFSFLQENNIVINKNVAICLLTGLLTDTYMFSNPATSSRSMAVASYLYSRGVRIYKIIEKLESVRTHRTLKLWGEVLSNVSYNSRWNIAVAVVSDALLRKHGLEEGSTDGLANFISHYYDAPVVLVLKQINRSQIKGSLRTTRPNIDVSSMAQFLGGGGHKKAAGFTLDGLIVETSSGWSIVSE